MASQNFKTKGTCNARYLIFSVYMSLLREVGSRFRLRGVQTFKEI